MRVELFQEHGATFFSNYEFFLLWLWKLFDRSLLSTKTTPFFIITSCYKKRKRSTSVVSTERVCPTSAKGPSRRSVPHIPVDPSNRDSLSCHTTTSPGVRRGLENRASSVYWDYREKSLDRGSPSTKLRLFKYSAPNVLLFRYCS